MARCSPAGPAAPGWALAASAAAAAGAGRPAPPRPASRPCWCTRASGTASSPTTRACWSGARVASGAGAVCQPLHHWMQVVPAWVDRRDVRWPEKKKDGHGVSFVVLQPSRRCVQSVPFEQITVGCRRTPTPPMQVRVLQERARPAAGKAGGFHSGGAQRGPRAARAGADLPGVRARRPRGTRTRRAAALMRALRQHTSSPARGGSRICSELLSGEHHRAVR